jgi:hypothetical protein
MKKFSSTAIAILLLTATFAQTSDKFTAAMQSKITLMDSAKDANALKDVSAAFERIGDAEKTQWLPYYYAALSQVNAGNQAMNSLGSLNNFANNADKLDPYADKAEALLNKAEALSKDNSEIFVVKKMIATLRLMGDPMNRYMTYGPEGATALEKAKKLNPDNPRPLVLEAMDKFYTPEQYGGSKEEAKKLFEEALKKYASFKPESDIHPTWGKNLVDGIMAQMK